MSAVRSVLFWALFGGLAGTWIGDLVARSFLPWINNPGAGTVRSQCECEPLATSVAGHMLTFEIYGLIGGALVFSVLSIVLGAGRKRKSEPSAPASPPPAAA